MAKFQKTKDEEDTMIENYIYSFGRFFLPDEYIYIHTWRVRITNERKTRKERQNGKQKILL